MLERLAPGETGEPCAEPVDGGAHPLRVGARVLPQGPADRLADPERAAVVLHMHAAGALQRGEAVEHDGVVPAAEPARR